MALVQVGTYGSTTEAELVRARLQANGIPSIVQADDASGTVPSLGGIEGIKVLVREDDLADAYEALERALPSGDQSDPHLST